MILNLTQMQIDDSSLRSFSTFYIQNYFEFMEKALFHVSYTASCIKSQVLWFSKDARIRKPFHFKDFLNKILTLLFSCLHHLLMLNLMSSKQSLRSVHIDALLKTGLNISLFYTSFCTCFPLSVLFCPFLKRSHLYLHALEYALELNVTGPLLGLRQFLTIERPVKMIKHAFYFMLRVLFIYELFSFLS